MIFISLFFGLCIAIGLIFAFPGLQTVGSIFLSAGFCGLGAIIGAIYERLQ